MRSPARKTFRRRRLQSGNQPTLECSWPVSPSSWPSSTRPRPRRRSSRPWPWPRVGGQRAGAVSEPAALPQQERGDHARTGQPRRPRLPQPTRARTRTAGQPRHNPRPSKRPDPCLPPGGARSARADPPAASPGRPRPQDPGRPQMGKAGELASTRAVGTLLCSPARRLSRNSSIRAGVRAPTPALTPAIQRLS